MTIQIKRGAKADLPSTAPDGQPLFCEDTDELFIGKGTSVAQVNANDAKSINGVPITGTPDLGKIPIGQGDGTAVFADPFCQGVQAEGTTASTLNPILISGKGADGNQHDISVDNAGKLNIANFPTTQTVSGTVSVSNFPGTQPVSGTVTANIGTTNGVALDASVLNPQVAPGTTAPSKILIVGGKTSDGTPQYQPIPLTAAGAAVNVSVSNSPSVSVSNFPATQPVSGTVTTTPPSNASTNVTQWAGTAIDTNSGNKSLGTLRVVIATDQPTLTSALAVSGTVTVNAGTGTFNNQQSNITADYDTGAGTQNLTMFGVALPASGGAVAGGTATNPFRIDPTGTTTQPVSGTVAVSNSFALDATLTGGTQKTKVTDGTNTAAVKAASTAAAATDPALVVAISPNNTVPTNVAQVNGSTVATAATGIQKVGLADGSGNAITSTSSALDVNLKSSITQNASVLPATSGGLSIATGSIGATKTAIKASAGQIYGYHIGNSNTSAIYVQIFNVASGGITLGTTAPDMSLFVPASGGAVFSTDVGIAFSTAITIAVTTTRAGSTAPTNTVDYNFLFK
jgi:hypothetical protein